MSLRRLEKYYDNKTKIVAIFIRDMMVTDPCFKNYFRIKAEIIKFYESSTDYEWFDLLDSFFPKTKCVDKKQSLLAFIYEIEQNSHPGLGKFCGGSLVWHGKKHIRLYKLHNYPDEKLQEHINLENSISRKLDPWVGYGIALYSHLIRDMYSCRALARYFENPITVHNMDRTKDLFRQLKPYRYIFLDAMDSKFELILVADSLKYIDKWLNLNIFRIYTDCVALITNNKRDIFSSGQVETYIPNSICPLFYLIIKNSGSHWNEIYDFLN